MAVVQLFLVSTPARAVIRDGGGNPSYFGKGNWIYYMYDATNMLGGMLPQ
ncbi:hypothetical protein [Pedosphaera parvula]|uniref:Uncharacterized protein n=1 Tax=Pedosphaera parvula (strain Ellin514) TaxID=320771 RepID=B9XI71_PEDPL|nr:hypothetical protein [Pedosphaera parvula]EEF60564.1 hypothetical protein Cflav_PD3534 [Pedosphaera parvula Ellin514]